MCPNKVLETLNFYGVFQHEWKLKFSSFISETETLFNLCVGSLQLNHVKTRNNISLEK